MRGKVDVLLGLQFGDEGKGKMVDLVSKDYDIVVRFAGGNNAGHTLCFNDEKYVLHLIPSGIFRPNCINIIANGVVIDPIELVKEIFMLVNLGIDVKSSLYISKKAHFILPSHILLDKSSEMAKGKSKIGSTLRGIAPSYIDKAGRNGIRVGDVFGNLEEKVFEMTKRHLDSITNLNDLEVNRNDHHKEVKKWMDAINILKNYNIIDSEYYINQALSEGKSVLAEGAQGALLDVDFGTYPYVTSSNTTIGGVMIGMGVPPQSINKVMGITKAYVTRVGSGPFPTELDDDIGENIRKVGQEFGATTGRPRRCGWIDLPLLKYSCMINGVTELNIMKLDVLSGFDYIKVCVGYLDITDKSYLVNVPYELNDNLIPVYKTLDGWDKDISNIYLYEDLPKECIEYIDLIESIIEIPVTRISVGPDRNQTITKNPQ